VQETQFQLNQELIFKTTEKYIAHSNDSKTAEIHVESARFLPVRWQKQSWKTNVNN